MKGIKYVLKPDEINFYFNDVLVITNSRRNPFIYGVVGENDTEKSVALYNYKIKSASEDRCEIDFFMDNLFVACELIKEGSKLKFKFVKGDGINFTCINFFKSATEPVFGLTASRTENQKREVLYSKKERIDKNSVNFEKYYQEYGNSISKKFRRLLKKAKPDTKLSFYLDKKYFFENVNVLNYKLEIKDNILIKTPQKNIEFNLVFAENVHVASNSENKNAVSVKKYYEKEVFVKMKEYREEDVDKFIKKTKLKVSGIIVENDVYDKAKTKVLITDIHNKGMEAIFSFRAEIKGVEEENSKKLYEIRHGENGEKSYNFESEEACRRYMNDIRRYLDIGADGIYLEEGFTENDVYIIHNRLKEIKFEYPEFTLFHDKISEMNDDFGYLVLKNKHLIKNFDKFSFDYANSGENRIGMECKKYKKRKRFTHPEFNINIYKIKQKKKK